MNRRKRGNRKISKMDLQELEKRIREEKDASARLELYERIAENFQIEAVDLLAMGLQDPDNGVKDVCYRALAHLKGENARIAAEKIVPLIADKRIEIRNIAGDALARLSTAAIDPLLTYLESDDADARKFACDIVGLIGGEDVLENINRLLDDPDENVKCTAVESLGNIGSQKSVETLIGVYGDSDEVKPLVIDALGKIGGKKSQDFLLDKLKNEKEVFLQSACIDALALSGEELEVCEKLTERLPDAPEELKLVLLKTIVAIAFRLEKQIELPEDLRYIARQALCDDDPDVRASGLLALGSRYDLEDVDSVASQFVQSDAETQQLIIFNLLTGSGVESVEKFFSHICRTTGADAACLEMLSLMSGFWSEAREENADACVRTIVEFLLQTPPSSATDIYEMLLQIDSVRCIANLRRALQSGSTNEKIEAVEIAESMSLKELEDDIAATDADDPAFKMKKKNALKTLRAL